MRCGFILLMLVMLASFGGVDNAPAQVYAPSAAPYPIETKQKQKPERKHRVRRRASKAAAPKPAKPTAQAPLPPRAPHTEAARAKTTGAKTAGAEAAQDAAAAPDPLAGIPASDRLKIEQHLYWSGDYGGPTDGDDPMTAAIKHFQKRNKAEVTGTLTDEQRSDILKAADRHAREYGWRVVVDPATGIRIGLPTKLVPNAHDAAHGTRWSAPHGEVSVETFRLQNTDLATVFADEKKKPKRQISRSTLNDDSFYISGMQGLRYFAVRAEERDGEVRGYTILFDQMMEGIVAPAALAIASAFSPFPRAPAPFATLSKKVEYGTGLIVSAAGYIVTARNVAQGCQVIVADGLGNAERIGEDKTHGLALLRVYGAGKLPVLSLPRAAPQAGDVTLIGIPDPKEQDGAKRLKEIKARLADDDAIELHEPVPTAGLPGAAALDAQGHFLGVMETRSFVLASADPGVPPLRLVPTAVIRDFLARHHVALSDSTNGDARAAAIRVICVRK
jgi:hypothetical protein